MQATRPLYLVFLAVADEAGIMRKIHPDPLASEWESIESGFRLIGELLRDRKPEVPGDETHVRLMFELLAKGSPSVVGGIRVHEQLLKAFEVEAAPLEAWLPAALLWCEIQQRLLVFAHKTPTVEAAQMGGMQRLFIRRPGLDGQGGQLLPVTEQQAEHFERQREATYGLARIIGSELNGLMLAFVRP